MNTPATYLQEREKEFDRLQYQLFYFLPELNEDELRASQTVVGQMHDLHHTTLKTLLGMIEEMVDGTGTGMRGEINISNEYKLGYRQALTDTLTDLKIIKNSLEK